MSSIVVTDKNNELFQSTSKEGGFHSNRHNNNKNWITNISSTTPAKHQTKEELFNVPYEVEPCSNYDGMESYENNHNNNNNNNNTAGTNKKGREVWWCSHFFFFMGSVLYLWLSIWEIRNEELWDDKDDDFQVKHSHISWHSFVSVTGAVCYICEAILFVTHEEFQKGATFGVGALAAIVSTVTAIFHVRISYFSAIGSVLAYLATAFVMLCIDAPPDDSLNPTIISNSFIVAGNLFFAIGSVIDVIVMCYYNDHLNRHQLMLVEHLDLLACVLWFVDAILYIGADCYYLYFEKPNLREPLLDMKRPMHEAAVC